MSVLRPLFVPIVVAGVVIGGVLAAGYTSAPPGRTVDVDIRYSRFVPSAVTVHAGVPVEFRLRNGGPIDHEWIVGDDALHTRHRTGTEPFHRERPTERSVPALTDVRTVVTFERPGTYRVICHLPGHEAYGMVGTITVTS